MQSFLNDSLFSVDDAMMNVRMRRARSRHFLIRALRKRMGQNIQDFLPLTAGNSNCYAWSRDFQSDLKSFDRRQQKFHIRDAMHEDLHSYAKPMMDDACELSFLTSEQRSKPPSRLKSRESRTKRYRSSFVMHCSNNLLLPEVLNRRCNISSTSLGPHPGCDFKNQTSPPLPDPAEDLLGENISIPVTHLSRQEVDQRKHPDFVSPKLLLHRSQAWGQRSQRQMARVKVAAADSRSYVRTEMCETRFPELVQGVSINRKDDQLTTERTLKMGNMEVHTGQLFNEKKSLCKHNNTNVLNVISIIDDDGGSFSNSKESQMQANEAGVEGQVEVTKQRSDLQPCESFLTLNQLCGKCMLTAATHCNEAAICSARPLCVLPTLNDASTHDCVSVVETQPEAAAEVTRQFMNSAAEKGGLQRPELGQMNVEVHPVHTESSFIGPSYDLSTSSEFKTLFHLPPAEDFDDRITDFTCSDEDNKEQIVSHGKKITDPASIHCDSGIYQDQSVESKNGEPVELKGRELVMASNEGQHHNECRLSGSDSSDENERSSSSSPDDVKPSLPEDTICRIPKFHFPTGKPPGTDRFKSTLKSIVSAFNATEKDKLTIGELTPITKACGCPAYWRAAIFKASQPAPERAEVRRSDVVNMWKRVASRCHDDASRFVEMLARPGNNHLEFNDFMVLLQDVVDFHPGLVFLRDAPEFHTRYMNTVIARIFYVVNRSWSGRITAQELRRSKFLEILASLEHEDDINAVPEFFSYEHFYVIYCKFWELDTDHDLVIDRNDLMRHANGALCSRLIDRVLSGAVTRWKTSDHLAHKMSYIDFVWFLISEEDKKSPTSIEYWFRCMDLDGDGRISMYEMEFFYEEQMMKLEQLDIEPLPFEDCVCQMLDMVKPTEARFITLADLKRCRLAHVFFDTFFNIDKYLEHEQKDPFAPQKDVDGEAAEPSDWDRFAMEEYDILVAEEQGSDQQVATGMLCDEDFGPMIEEEFFKLGLEGSDFDKGDFVSDSRDFIG